MSVKMNTHIPKWTPILDFGSWSPNGLLKSLDSDFKGQNPSHWRVLYIIEKLLKLRCLKLGSHNTFGHLKHKLWPKERPVVKLAVWLLTTKSQESTRFSCMHVTCNKPFENFQQGLQLCFRPHPDRRSAHKVIALQSRASPNFGNFGTPI
jgi:hypothetical protein